MDTVEPLVRDLDASDRVLPAGRHARRARPVRSHGRSWPRTQIAATPPGEATAGTLTCAACRVDHTAIRFGDQHQLAASLLSMAERVPQTFTGSADHPSARRSITDPGGQRPRALPHHRATSGRSCPTAGADGPLALDPNARSCSALTDASTSGDTAATVTRAPAGGDILGEGVLRRSAGVRCDGLISAAPRSSRRAATTTISRMNTWQSAGAGPRSSARPRRCASWCPPATTSRRFADRIRSHGVDGADDGHALRPPTRGHAPGHHCRTPPDGIHTKKKCGRQYTHPRPWSHRATASYDRLSKRSRLPEVSRPDRDPSSRH